VIKIKFAIGHKGGDKNYQKLPFLKKGKKKAPSTRSFFTIKTEQ